MAARRAFVEGSWESANVTTGAATPHSGGPAHLPPPASTPSTSFQSDSTAVERNSPNSALGQEEGEDVANSFNQPSGSGLGIAAADVGPRVVKRVSIQAIPRRAVGLSPVSSPPAPSPGTLSPPDSSEPFFGGFVADSGDNTPDLRRERSSPQIGTFEEFRRGILKPSGQCSTTIDERDEYSHASDTAGLSNAPSIKSAYAGDFHPTHACPTSRDFYHSRFTWLNISVVIICLFSCIFSGIFLVLAIRGPHYGRRITSHGAFKPADAILLTAIVAKLIELSFVTSFVAFLGQALSRRAFMKDGGRGVTLSELSMWRWVVQPGTLIVHHQTARYAGASLLGILSLLSAILATLYSSAATALVQPVLRVGSWDSGLVLSGKVKADFTNVNYVKALCRTPIHTDEENAGNTCLQIEHAGLGYLNYQKYLAEWDVLANDYGNGTADQQKRPPAFGLLYENTTVTGQWIDIANTSEVSREFGRAVNNVSLAMPHAGVFAAARDQQNGILQPEELNSEGTYSLRASVPSPVMNVLCANMNEEELKPIVYDTFNDDVVNITTWPDLSAKVTRTNKTQVDAVFGWKNGSRFDSPPVFAKYPKPFNTIMNHTSYPWGRPSIYLLGQGGDSDDGSNATGIFVLCKLEAHITPACSTRYSATGSGGTMEALCGESAGDMAYIKSKPDAPSKLRLPNWRDIGFDWSNSLSLNTGVMDGAASNSRLLTQLMLKPSESEVNNLQVDLSTSLPSVAEALAVMSGCTLLKGTLDAPFVMFWNYTPAGGIFKEGQPQYFNASLKAQQYASGGVDSASKGWIIVLGLVFVMNLFIFGYFMVHQGNVTDFQEPSNLFALAVNSPPSQALAGSCGGGPEGKHYMVDWFVNHEGSHLFMEPSEKTPMLSDSEHGHVHKRGRAHDDAPREVKAAGPLDSILGAVGRALRIKERTAPTKLRSGNATEELRHSNARPVDVGEAGYEMDNGHTRTKRQYAKLANRRSML